MDFAVPADHSILLKECEKRDKYTGLTRVMKKLWNMNVTVIPSVTDALDTVIKGLVKRLEGIENKNTSGDHRNRSIIKIG